MPRPDTNKLTVTNDIGLRIEKKCRLPEFTIYEENGSVHMLATVVDTDGDEHQALQYLSASEAMAFAKAFEQCAIRALKNERV